MDTFKKYLLLVSGTISLSLGIIGIFVPLLPTTPFLLLSAACYARSSQILYQWMHSNRWFGEYLSNYQAGRGIQIRHKVSALFLLWLTIGYCALFIVTFIWIKIVLFLIASAVTFHILKIKTYKPGKQ